MREYSDFLQPKVSAEEEHYLISWISLTKLRICRLKNKNLNANYDIRLVLVFSVAFSLATLGGPMSGNFHLPSVQLGHANAQLCQVQGAAGACSEFWYPAGPEMNTELVPIFSDPTAEYTNLQSPSPSIDFADAPCPPSLCASLTASPNFLVTAPVPQTGYYEIQFMLANNFWGCSFNFGNAACGIQIRQGIAHMIDKTAFANNEPSLTGVATPIDNPVSTTSAGSLLSPNPCGYDASFPQSGSNCVVGAPGGTAYHLNAATGANGFPWVYAPGSNDLNAAAQHFVSAGLATGFNPGTSVLTGIAAGAASNPPNFFVRNDDPARLNLGQSLAEEICYLFTGTFAAIPTCSSGGNTYLTVTQGPSTAFPGFFTSTTSVNLSWGMYTAAYTSVPFFDDSLYFTYNSRLVSGIPSIQPPSGPCSGQAVPTASATNYMYACSSTYDSLSSQMETAPCLAALGDPVNGASSNLPTSPGNGICPGSSQLSAHSAGIQAEANFGASVLTLPIFERTVQFGYLNNGWIRAINNNDVGLPNYFTWLNAYNPTPPLAGTIRQGFSQTTRSVNPYLASTPQDLYVIHNVYDSLYAVNPLDPSQDIDWMTTSTQQLSDSMLTYAPPAGTLTTYRFFLRDDLFFQDGTPVTSYDVAFSYLSMVGTGAFLGTGASMMTGITILNPRQFDISVNSTGPFVLDTLTSVPILPGHIWTNAGGAAWSSAVTSCSGNTPCADVQYTLTGSTVKCAGACTSFPAALMAFNPGEVTPTYDPIASHTFVGSGPWQCGTVTASGSGTCTSSGSMNPPFSGSYTLTRFGNGLAPASSISGIYFRSAGNLALWIWSQDNGDLTHQFLNVSVIAYCYGMAVNLSDPCGHFQEGIGNPGSGAVVGVTQFSIVARFFGVNWIAPFDWQTNPPLGIAPFPPVLYEGSATLSPASVVGCPGGYDC
jgi:hypothetical protein